ncbi:MAG: prephenate dehydrogenase [Clostridia bacterium]|nr:prephenate dehydrogenase [Clostridia bacterium]
MKLNKDTKILIVGLGVIGGGYAAALTDSGYKVKCITKELSDIQYAYEHGIIDYGTTEVDPALIAEAELIVFALYPTIFIDWIKKYQHLFTSGCIITDVTGVKSSVVYEVQGILRDDVEFISAHPMAGRERSGVEYSDPKVFRGANYIVTPTEKNSEEAIELCCELGRQLGFAKISRLSPEEHDKMIAFLSQLTHCIAVVLMNANTSEGLEKYTGDSFRDLTRIAKINDRMWSELFMMNKNALLCEMDSFIDEFIKFRSMIENGDVDAMRERMRASSERRTLFDKPRK